MAERTDEQVREESSERDTEDLLAEVESLTDDATGERDATDQDAGRIDPGGDGILGGDTTSRDRSTTDERAVGEQGRSGGERSRMGGLRERASGLFSVRGVLVALVLSTIGLVIGGLVPLVPMSGAIGVFGAAFALGLGSGERRYVETGLAGAAVLGVSTFLEYLQFAMFAGAGFAPALLGVALGLVVGVIGHYFGRDLRGGLTRDL